jgi:uncharacterized protein YutE (UPF0331/DUF86 family)
MVKIEILQKRINKARQYLDYLEDIKVKYSYEEFKNDPMIYGSVERFLHLIIEALMDIGNHIISDQNLGQVEFYNNIPDLLFNHNYLNEEQRDLFLKIIGFRNILVHDYLEINSAIVYNILEKNLSDLESILKEYAKLL